MTVYISDCGGIVGPPLVRWLLDNTSASIVGTNARHERLDAFLNVARFRFYVVSEHDDSALLTRVIDPPDVVVVLSSLERQESDPHGELVRTRAELIRSCAEIHAQLIYVTPEWGDDDGPSPGTSLERVLRAESERVTRNEIETQGVEELDYIVLHVSDVMNDELELRPASQTPSLLESLTAAVRDQATTSLEVRTDEQVQRLVTAADDVAECIGRAIMGDRRALNRRELFVGNVGNLSSNAEIAGRILEKLRTRLPEHPLPRLAIPELRPPSPSWTYAADAERSRHALGWVPRRSLDEILEAGVANLIKEQSAVDERR